MEGGGHGWESATSGDEAWQLQVRGRSDQELGVPQCQILRTKVGGALLETNRESSS